MTIQISWELRLFNFERHNILWPRMGHPCEKVRTIWISRGYPLFNFEHHDILCTRIGHPFEKLWPFEFLDCISSSISSVSIYYAPELNIRMKSFDHLNFWRGFIAQFRASRYIIRLNRTSVWKVMTIKISRELPLFNFERLYILCPRIGQSSDKLWPFEFHERFHCSISSVPIY